MGEIINPYIAGAPVTEQRMFFGREDIFQWIENSITGQYADHILVIHGQRRVGKTSVLKQLGNRLPSHYIPVFFDLQGRTHTALDRFLWWLAREIVRVLKQEQNIDLPLPDKEDYSKDVEYFENRFLPDLKPVLDSKTLLLTFDEFDNLEESEVKEELARPLVDHLRRLMGQPNLNFIFSIGSSGRKLENMQAEYTDFFKAALYKKISFLNEEQTHHLITRPVAGVLTYDKQAVERIYNIASGHPYFTQLTCHELFARCQRTAQRQITIEDVEAVLDDVVERGTVNLKFVWDEASDIEKWGLAGLASIDKVDSHALADYLRKNHVRFSESDLTSGLLHLREKDVLTSDHRFVIQLLQRWLQKNRPIEQVREELTEVNPIANRYIEIGLEFKDAGLYEKAISSFQEALTISKENIQAQVNIALIYMDQKMHDKAIVEFEKALAMDDEDVSARSGLCEAHLALGDAAMAKGRAKDAAQSYLRVLAINTEHTEARQRMAELSRRRAEEALTNGKDTEALDAFAEALRYTPEDSALNARVEQVKAEKRAKRFADLISKSEKEAKAKNWTGVIKSLEEALILFPSDEMIPKKIEEAKAAAEKAQALAAIYAEAQKAYTDKNYDTAVSLFKKIVLEDENYKDASRLLAQAIELRRTAPKWWQRKPVTKPEPSSLPHPIASSSKKKRWAVGGLAILVVGIMGVLFWLGGDGLLNSMEETSNNSALTVIPAKSFTATSQALETHFAIANTGIRNKEPYFETSFDTLPEGKLIISSINDEIISMTVSDLESTIFAVEYDVQILNSSPEGHCVFSTEMGSEDKTRRALSSAVFSNARSGLGHWVYPDGHLEINGAASKINISKPNTILLIVIKEQIAVIINGELAYTVSDTLGEAAYTSQHFSAAYTTDCEFDNYKIWDLNDVFPSASESDLSPAMQIAQKTIQDQAPFFQTNFDSMDFDGNPVNAKLEGGKLIVSSVNDAHAGMDMSDLESDKFAVEFDVRILDSSPGGHCIFETSNGYDYGNSAFRAMSAMVFLNGQAVLSHYVHPEQYPDLISSEDSFDFSKPNTVTLIFLGDEIAAFVNGQFAYTAIDPAGSAMYTVHALSANYTAECEYDNFKVWDLSELDPAVRTAFAAIQSEEPLYQTTFDAWDFGDPVENARVENGKLVLSNDSDINTYVPLNNFESKRFAVEFDTQILESLDYASCSLGIGNDNTNFRVIFWQNGQIRVDRPKLPDDLIIGSGNFDPSISNTVKLIVIDDLFSLFINDEIAFTRLDPEGSTVYTSGLFEASSPITCEFDNYKIWDLSRVDFSTSIGAETPAP